MYTEQVLCVKFCKVTRSQLQERLEADHSAGKLEISTLLQALQKTIEFEQDLQVFYQLYLQIFLPPRHVKLIYWVSCQTVYIYSC